MRFITVHVARPTSSLLQPSVVGRIGSIGVIERMRGCGVGRALIGLAQEWSRSSGAADMRLTVWQFNQSAIDLYRELGYEIRAFEMGKAL